MLVSPYTPMSQVCAPAGQAPVPPVTTPLVTAGIADWLNAGANTTTAGLPATVMENGRLLKMMSLAITGFDTSVQSLGFAADVPVVYPAAAAFGQVTVGLVNAGLSSRLCACVTRPAGSGTDVVTGWVQPAPVSGLQFGGGVLANWAPSVSNSTPAVEVVSFETTVLFLKSTATASWMETPPPSQPATLFTMMLLVTAIVYHCVELFGLSKTSLPLMFCSRSPPPSPDSAVLPIIRLASTTVPDPTPSDSVGPASMSMLLFSASVPSGALPSMINPPPFVVNDGLVL